MSITMIAGGLSLSVYAVTY